MQVERLLDRDVAAALASATTSSTSWCTSLVAGRVGEAAVGTRASGPSGRRRAARGRGRGPSRARARHSCGRRSRPGGPGTGPSRPRPGWPDARRRGNHKPGRTLGDVCHLKSLLSHGRWRNSSTRRSTAATASASRMANANTITQRPELLDQEVVRVELEQLAQAEDRDQQLADDDALHAADGAQADAGQDLGQGRREQDLAVELARARRRRSGPSRSASG